MKRAYVVLIILFLFQSILNSALIEIENEYIKILGVPETGGFIVKTTGGDPELDKDQDVLLLYEDYPPTSITTVYVNDRGYKFGRDPGFFTSRMMKRGDVIIAVWNVANIDVTQIIKIVKGPTTGRMDTVEIQYNVVNKGGRNNRVGLRIMLDTYLGRKDGVAFKTPKIEEITEEIALTGNQVPDYWYSFDDLKEPTIKAQGSLKISGFPVPDKIVFSSWDRFNKYLWDLNIRSGRTFKRASGVFDSAVAVYWDTKDLAPDDGFTIKTLYGLYAPVEFKGEIFSITLANPDFTKGDKPFKANLDVQNISPYKAEKVTAEIILPDTLKLSFDENNIKNLASIEINDNKTTSWSLSTAGTQTGYISFKVKVSGTVDNKIETEIVEGKIQFVKEEKAVVAATKSPYTLYDFAWLNKIVREINNKSCTNDDLLGKVNKLLAEYKKAKYSQKDGKEDRNKIGQREKRVGKLEEEIPDAVKSAVKHGEK